MIKSDVPMIMLHGIWMAEYKKWEPNIYAGGFSWAAKAGWGGEIFNFLPVDGCCYGYVEVNPRKIKGKPRTISVRLENLGASKEAESVSGVLVVWTAPDPEGHGRKVIGWYRNATVYRWAQEPKGTLKESRAYDKNNVCSYRVKAAASDCVLLPPEERVLTIPPRRKKQKGAPGQSAVFYPRLQNGHEAKKLMNRVLQFIETGTVMPTQKNSLKAKRGQQNTERRKAIEEAAIALVKKHFRTQLKYAIEDLQEYDMGYDLLATKGDETLCIEVKGRSIDEIQADFTVNEYKKILLHEKGTFEDGNYRICIVTDALNETKQRAQLHHFSWWREGSGKGKWVKIDGSETLIFNKVIAARATVLP